MTHHGSLFIEELHDACIEIHDSFDGAKTSLDELQTEIADEISGFASAFDDIRDELERCNQLIRRLNRRISPVLSHMMEQEDNEESFAPKCSESRTKHLMSFEEMLSN